MISTPEFAEGDVGSGRCVGRSDVYSEGYSGSKTKLPKLAPPRVLLVEKAQLSSPSGDRCQVDSSLS